MTRKIKNGQRSIKDVKEQHKEDEEAERWQEIWGHCKQTHRIIYGRTSLMITQGGERQAHRGGTKQVMKN